MRARGSSRALQAASTAAATRLYLLAAASPHSPALSDAWAHPEDRAGVGGVAPPAAWSRGSRPGPGLAQEPWTSRTWPDGQVLTPDSRSDPATLLATGTRLHASTAHRHRAAGQTCEPGPLRASMPGHTSFRKHTAPRPSGRWEHNSPKGAGPSHGLALCEACHQPWTQSPARERASSSLS